MDFFLYCFCMFAFKFQMTQRLDMYAKELTEYVEKNLNLN